MCTHLKESKVGMVSIFSAIALGVCLGGLTTNQGQTIGMAHRHWEPARVFSGYSVRKACIGSILVARLAGSQAAAMVITETAAIAMEIAVGSSGLNS